MTSSNKIEEKYKVSLDDIVGYPFPNLEIFGEGLSNMILKLNSNLYKVGYRAIKIAIRK